MASRILAYLLQEVTFRRLLTAAVAMLLAAPSGASAQATVICHATGDPASPYQQLELQAADTIEHLTHGDDLIPAPEGGCPAQVAPDPTPDPYALPDTVPTAVPSPARPRRRPARRPRPRRTAPQSAVLPAVSQGNLGTTGTVQGDTLPLTGQEVPAVALMGLGFLFAGAGLRLRLRL
jgi:hypothetical protein